MKDSGEKFDFIVVGAGIMGSCTAYQLAKRGHAVLLLDQFDFLHQMGSSHGDSRTIRLTYPEPYYTALVSQAWLLWEEAQSEIGYQVITKTPHFDMGPADNKSLRAVISNCASDAIPHQILRQDQLSDHFSGVFTLPDGWVGVRTESGGIIRATKAVSMFQALAIKRGAVLRDRTEVREIQRDESGRGIWVCLEQGKKLWAKKCVFTVGAWTKKLVKTVTGTVLPIQPLHTSIFYWRIAEGSKEKFSPESGFPTFASYGEPYIYGTPSVEFPGLVKIAVHGGYPCEPDRRTWATDTGLIKDALVPWIEGRFQGRVEPVVPVMTQPCMYSMTPDEDFVIDFLGGEFGRDVVVGGGFSGHGFKMGPVLGKILADLVESGEAGGVELSKFGMNRFNENPKGNAKEYEDQVSSHWLP